MYLRLFSFSKKEEKEKKETFDIMHNVSVYLRALEESQMDLVWSDRYNVEAMKFYIPLMDVKGPLERSLVKWLVEHI